MTARPAVGTAAVAPEAMDATGAGGDAGTCGAEAGRGARTAAPRPARTRAPVRTRIRRWQVLTGVALALAWEVAGRVWDFIYLPPLSEVLTALVQMLVDGTIVDQLGASLGALGVGLAVAVTGGVLIGCLIGMVPAVRTALEVYVDAMMAAPMVAFVPLFILLFGLGFETRLVIIVAFAIFPIITNTATGVRNADARIVEMARSFGAPRRDMVLRIQLPMALPQVTAGLRLGVSRGVDGLITGEVIIAAVGIGGLVSRYGSGFTMDRLYAVVILIAALALGAVKLTEILSRVLFGRRATA
ncbi:ABC transporter permease [Litorihabitans aurantiacus]|uniref:ABC transporter permease n=1 Tax=Litorihabitans aurantiacus TaxID=1930061 RepID=A0AA37UM10_9MICO|nr:ABC transporter permease [Litorihabitans aurantiacus]GMA30499.1 ABC transporter permease [Litorihabitans aurantiacus]